MTCKSFGSINRLVFGVVLLIAAGAAGLKSAGKNPFNQHQKTYYASPATVDFVRPGLALKVLGAKVAQDGTISTTVSISDPEGLPLDKDGVITPGAVSVSCTVAVVPKGTNDFVSYTSFPTTSKKTGATSKEVWFDFASKAVKIGDGQYTLTFADKAPAGFDATATHRAGCSASRDLSAFNLGTNRAYATLDFTPNGAPPAQIHDIVRTSACNTCHDNLVFHGGEAGGADLCVLCHTKAASDPTSGNTLYFPVMIHKIHMGSSLPSVANGKPYQIVGYMDSVSDFSTVVDPADVRRCEVCHDQKSGAAQASFFMTKPTRAACGSCHDDVNFATGTKHVGGFQPDDNQCATCHSPKGERPFDASILGAHVVASDTALAYPQNPNSLITGVAIHITGVRNTSAGQKPIVEFTIKDTKGNSLALSKLEDLSFVLAGPTTDYGYTSFGSNVTTPGYVSEDGTVATCDGTSHCTFTFQHAIPAKATGTYAIATESERLEDILTGTNLAQTVESGTANQVVYFSVDGSPVLNRRTVVEKANCNGCHVALTGHGARRNDPEFCILCHNPSLTDAATRAQSKNPVDLKTPPQALNFNLMIHKIHTGANLAAMGASYLEISHNGRHRDFSGVLYPVMGPNGSSGDTGKCYLCHVNGSEQNLPTGMNVVAQPQGMFNPMPAVTSACLSCHVTKPAASHAIANTNSMGESCEVCHDAHGEFAVDKVHAQ